MPLTQTVLARAAWSRLAEPGDAVAHAVVAALGPVEALTWLRGSVAGDDLTLPGGGALEPAARHRLRTAVARWAPRLESLDPTRELRVLARLGGTVVVPEDPRWPGGLDDLGAQAPQCLWVRGSADLATVLSSAVAVIGARACTAYGDHVTAQVAGGVADAGWTVVSGGAYGIDAVAHRAALTAPGRTVAFLAGGVDRLYPVGNARLLHEVAEAGGALVSEVPPGSVPSKSRFLQRNRLIAAAAQATVVVEAAWRSGALSTAGHAAALLRPVGAVPGPVTSAASAGCHRLLRDGAAVCVTDANEVLELVGRVGLDLAPEHADPPRAGDDLEPVLRRTLDALPVRRPAPPEAVARAAGLAVAEVRAALGRLELAGRAVHREGLWRRAAWQSGQAR